MSACSNSKSIGNYLQNASVDATDIFLIQKGTEYKKEPRSMHIATQAEVDAGTDATKYVTPATLAAVPKQDLGVFDFGMLLVNAQPATNETFTIDVDGIPIIFEFTAGGGVTVGDVEVIKGVSTTLTAAAWIIAINTSILTMSAIVNPVTSNQINWITDAANVPVVLTDGTTGDILSSQAGGERAAANTIPIYREYLVTAADQTAGSIMMRFPVSSFPDGVLMQYFTLANDVNDDPLFTVGSDTYTITGGDISITSASVPAGVTLKVFGIGVI